ncbi:MAG TPA: SEC-C metal-binding domain-containing protein [Elusimicrobiales bacterium]|nr:SEC-C metal-binding domain-containing protein [Elusimicrobiales bacterium]
MFWDIFKKKQPETAKQEQGAAPAVEKKSEVKAIVQEKPAPNAAATPEKKSAPQPASSPADQEKELEKEIEKDISRMEPGLASQLKNPAVRQKLLELAKKMLKDGVDIKSEKSVKAWLKDHPEELGGGQGKVETFKRVEPKIGRNDPCLCGSGKKYKKCCGQGQS